VRTFPNFVRSRAKGDNATQRVEGLQLRDKESELVLIIALEVTNIVNEGVSEFKLAADYLAFFQLASITLWLNVNEAAP